MDKSFELLRFVRETDLRGASFRNASLPLCRIGSDVKLEETDFSGADLRLCNFESTFNFVSYEYDRQLITLDWLRERGAIWDENNPPLVGEIKD